MGSHAGDIVGEWLVNHGVLPVVTVKNLLPERALSWKPCCSGQTSVSCFYTLHLQQGCKTG